MSPPGCSMTASLYERTPLSGSAATRGAGGAAAGAAATMVTGTARVLAQTNCFGNFAVKTVVVTEYNSRASEFTSQVDSIRLTVTVTMTAHIIRPFLLKPARFIKARPA